MGASDPGSEVREGGTADNSGAGQGDSAEKGTADAAAGGSAPTDLSGPEAVPEAAPKPVPQGVPELVPEPVSERAPGEVHEAVPGTVETPAVADAIPGPDPDRDPQPQPVAEPQSAPAGTAAVTGPVPNALPVPGGWAAGYPPVPPPPPGFQARQVWGASPAVPAFAPVPVGTAKARSRVALYVSLAVAGFLVIAAGTAGTVVALGSPQGGSVSVQAAAPKVAATPSPSATAAAPATTAPVVVPTIAPSPTSSVKGSVDDGSHSGDLRFFLLPIPDGAQPIDDATGSLESLKQLSQNMDDPSQGLADLKSWNCTGGAFRAYRSSDATMTITTELLHFADGSDASGWFSGFRYEGGSSFSVSQVPDSGGWEFDPSGGDTFGSLHGYGYDGDVMYEIDIDGPGKIPHSLLIPLMQRERKLLSTGH